MSVSLLPLLISITCFIIGLAVGGGGSVVFGLVKCRCGTCIAKADFTFILDIIPTDLLRSLISRPARVSFSFAFRRLCRCMPLSRRNPLNKSRRVDLGTLTFALPIRKIVVPRLRCICRATPFLVGANPTVPSSRPSRTRCIWCGLVTKSLRLGATPRLSIILRLVPVVLV